MKGERRELTPQMKKRRRKKNIIGFTFILPSLIGWEYPKVCVNLQTDVR